MPKGAADPSMLSTELPLLERFGDRSDTDTALATPIMAGEGVVPLTVSAR